MAAPKRVRIDPTDDWQQLRLRVRFPEQEGYELLRPIVLFGHRIAHLTDARLFATRHRSLQPFSGDLGDVEWRPAMPLRPYAARRLRGTSDAQLRHTSVTDATGMCTPSSDEVWGRSPTSPRCRSPPPT